MTHNLYKHLPTYRNPFQLCVNSIMFQHSPEKDELLSILRCGFSGNYSTLPLPWGPIKNYFSSDVIAKARTRFQSETQKGRMIGGPGWSRTVVRDFLGCDFYVIPCGAVPKGDDPHGCIIHYYSYAPDGIHSINNALIDNSVNYISFKERVRSLAGLSWYIAVDLKNGYRQLPLHPRDWPTQVYMLDTNEHYIDVCMPFGKANSSKIFCF